MKFRFRASEAALLSVIVVVGGSFVWWYRNRPSFLLYQAHSELGQANQSAVITEYKRLLEKKDLTRDEEIRFRKALGEFYVRAVQENGSLSLYYKDDYVVDHPFLAAAQNEFKRVVELDPKDSLSHYYLGRILWLKRLESFAMEELNLSRESDPKIPEPLRYLSLIAQERGDPAHGRELALQALAINPQYDDARMALVSSYSLLGEHERALDEYDRLSIGYRSNPDTQAQHAFYLAKENHWTEAMEEIDEALRSAPENGEVKITYGRILLERGLYDEASGQFAQAGALMPHNIWPLVWQAQTYARRGMCEDAARMTQIIVEGLPRWAWSHYVNAQFQLCHSNEKLALSALEEALRLSTDFIEAIELKAQILLAKGQYEELGVLLRPLLDQKINQSEAYTLLAQSFYQQGQMALAQESAESAIKLNQRNPWAFVWLAEARFKQKDEAGAERAFQNAISLNPYSRDIAGMYDYFQVVQNNQKAATAEHNLVQALDKDSRNALLWILLGDVRTIEKNYPEAVQAYQSAVDITSYSLRAQLGLVAAYHAQNLDDRAASALSAALSINPKNKDVLAWRSKLRRAA